MNYIECLDIAATKLGKDELAIDIKFAFEDKHYELMQTAAELYAHLSNSHKHGVVRPASASGSEGEPLPAEGHGEANTCAGHDYTFYKTDVLKMCVHCGKKEYFDRV